MPKRDLTRDMPPLSLRAAIGPGSVNPEKRTVEVVWTTGARVLRGFWEPYWEELSLDPKHVRMERLNNGAPFLDSHASYDGAGSVVGVVESAQLGKDGGTATIRFAKAEDDPKADAIFRKVKDGILQNVSVGYRIHKLEKTGEVVNEGTKEEAPVLRAVDWEPYEISVVPMGADDGAGFRSARGMNPCAIIAREEQSMDPTKKPDPIPAAAPADPPAAVTELVRAASERSDRENEERARAEKIAAERAVQEERDREVSIRGLVRSAKLGDEVADKLVKSGAKLDHVRAVILDHLTRASDAGPSGHIRFEAGEDQGDKFVRGACASIFQRAGLSRVIEGAKKVPTFASEFRDVTTDPGEFAGMRLVDLARAALELRGISTRGLHGDALVKRALSYRDAGQNVAGDFPILLETAVNKTFLGQYALTPTTWRRWCGVKSLQDFRTSTFYRPGTFSVLDAVTEAGEVKHKNIPDGSKATLAPSTKGNIVGISRKAMVNDDLGVFRDLASGLGLAAAITVEAAAYALVTVNSGLGPTQSDSQPLFHTNRSNIGPTGAMTVTTLDGARAVMGKQKDVSASVYLDLRPRVWLGPLELGSAARVNNEAQYDPTANKFQAPNFCRGLFSDVVDSAYLSASSATRHYLLADPGLYPVFAVGFLDGREAPVIDSYQNFEYDGLQVRILMDYATGVLDYRGAVTCAGS